MKTSGEKLRDLRKAYGLTQSKFGEKIGVKRGNYNAYENDFNLLPTSVKYEIMRATGIGLEYFDTDMSLDEAFEKFGNYKLKDIETTNCTFYESLEDFSQGKYSEKPFKMPFLFLELAFVCNFGKFDYNFININNSKFHPNIKKGEVLIVLVGKEVVDGESIIVDFDGDLMIVRYFKRFDEIILENNKSEKTFSLDEFKKKVKILGVIVAKYSATLLSEPYL